MRSRDATPVPPPIERALVHPQVDRVFIGRLVREFYGRVRHDARLGPIFAEAIQGDWEPHLEKMTDFWCAVILKDGSYQGRPVPAHLKLKTVVPEDFAVWLGIFQETVDDLCEPEVATVFVERAQRIARSLQLAMFFRLPAAGIEADRSSKAGELPPAR
ncbi:group III truncated hemoglobin [Nitratireductor sp. ZSWI3]|uniref:group III truncated hemoglobin n=1 Tax=Nitratireductor sp. ZSWI3 TaxID=2966359 RepID=UPI002150459C|nr:group III truncated hemoglobin [Nitratireductor sp. ZSWI3]MCR4264598.1 group III truncated hemoglobin [Nitratireductor sp. ZSWI3]